MKKDGGNIKNWQLHNLTYKDDSLKQLKEMYPEAVTKPNPMIVTGTVVNEPTGRWKPGNHFRSSMIVKINRKNYNIETLNTIYHFDPETEGQDTIPDLGNGVLGIFY